MSDILPGNGDQLEPRGTIAITPEKNVLYHRGTLDKPQAGVVIGVGAPDLLEIANKLAEQQGRPVSEVLTEMAQDLSGLE